MCEVISFKEARRFRDKDISTGSTNAESLDDNLLNGYRHLDAARHNQRQMNVLENHIWTSQSQIKLLKDQQNISLVKSATAFCNAANRGCKEAIRELKANFPVTYEDNKEQNKDEL